MIDLIRKTLENGARLSFGGKWMVINVSINQYEVFTQRLTGNRQTYCMTSTASLEEALRVLMEV